MKWKNSGWLQCFCIGALRNIHIYNVLQHHQTPGSWFHHLQAAASIFSHSSSHSLHHAQMIYGSCWCMVQGRSVAQTCTECFPPGDMQLSLTVISTEINGGEAECTWKCQISHVGLQREQFLRLVQSWVSSVLTNYPFFPHSLHAQSSQPYIY